MLLNSLYALRLSLTKSNGPVTERQMFHFYTPRHIKVEYLKGRPFQL